MINSFVGASIAARSLLLWALCSASLLHAQQPECCLTAVPVELVQQPAAAAQAATEHPDSADGPSHFLKSSTPHPTADLGAAYWQSRIENKGIVQGMVAQFFRSAAYLRPGSSPGSSPSGSLTRPGFVAQPPRPPSSSPLWQVFEVNPFGVLGDRFSMTVAGSSGVVVDGVDMTPLFSRGQFGVANYFLVPGSTLQFRSIVAYFAADTNVTPGGQGIIVSRKASPRWHGEFFGIPRVNLLAANVGLANKNLQFSSNSYGGTTGGPILKGGAYLFMDYAGLRQSIGRLLIGYVPSSALIQAMKASSPALEPVLASYPAGTRALAGSVDAMVFQGIGNQIDNEDALAVRLDENFPGHAGRRRIDSIFARANLDGAMTQAPFSGGEGFLDDRVTRHTRPIGGVVGWSEGFGPRLGHEFRLGYVRGTLETSNQSSLNLPYAIAVSGLTTLAGQQTSYGASNAYSAQDAWTLVRGRSSLAAGGGARRLDLNLSNSNGGRVNYASLAGFAANAMSWANYSQALPGNTLGEWQATGWLQETWKVRANLQAGAGVRYQFFNRLQERGDKAIPFDFSTCGEQGYCAAGDAFNRINALDLDPRASFAWGPDRGPSWLHSNLVLRAGGGIYHANGLLSEQSQPIYNEVANFALSAAKQPGLSYPITPFLVTDPSGIASPRGMDRQRSDPYATEWSTSVQGRLPSRFVAEAAYFGAQGTHLPTITYLNLIDPSTHLRPHSTFGPIRYLDNTGSSTLHALGVFLTRNLPNGTYLTAGYNWAHEIDDGAAGDIGVDAPQNPACARCERASGDQDVRHTAGMRALYPIPFGADRPMHFQSRFLNQLTGDWNLMTAFSGRTALPVNVTVDRLSSAVPTGYTVRQRPDRVWGASIRPPAGPSMSQWLNPAAFAPVAGLYGTTGRNAALGPSQWRIDSGLRRQILLPRNVRFGIRADMQNIFNHAQYAQPLADWSTPQFGEIISPSNPGRVGAGGARAMFISFDANY